MAKKQSKQENLKQLQDEIKKTVPRQYRSGRFTTEESLYVRDNCEHKVYTEIAKDLNRDPASVKLHIEKKFKKEVSLTAGAAPIRNFRNDIAKKKFWPTLKQQFSDPELDLFQYHWNEIQEQFFFDILPTEEMQILDLIKCEIMMMRITIQQKENEDIVKRIEVELAMANESKDEESQNHVTEIEKQLLLLRNGSAGLNKEYREFQQQKNKIFQDLKATRKDRIQRIDAKKESFISWIEDLVDNPKTRREMGIQMEKMRLAIKQEEKRLSQYHEYHDGGIDQPLLNHATVKDDNG